MATNGSYQTFVINGGMIVGGNLLKQGTYNGQLTGFSIAALVSDGQYDLIMNLAQKIANENHGITIIPAERFATAAEVRRTYLINDPQKQNVKRLGSGRPALQKDKMHFDEGKMIINFKVPSVAKTFTGENGIPYQATVLSDKFVIAQDNKPIEKFSFLQKQGENELKGWGVNMGCEMYFFEGAQNGEQTIPTSIVLRCRTISLLGKATAFKDPETDYEGYFSSFDQNNLPGVFQQYQGQAPQQPVAQPAMQFAPQAPQAIPQQPVAPQAVPQAVPQQPVQYSAPQFAPPQAPAPAPRAPQNIPQQPVPQPYASQAQQFVPQAPQALQFAPQQGNSIQPPAPLQPPYQGLADGGPYEV
jgi:hypothetical protein